MNDERLAQVREGRTKVLENVSAEFWILGRKVFLAYLEIGVVLVRSTMTIS